MELQRIEQGLGRLFQTVGYGIGFCDDPERDLDDALQVNYAEFGTLVAEVKTVTGKEQVDGE